MAILEFYLVGVGAVDDPRKIIKQLFFFSRFSLTKSAAKVSKEDSRRPPSEPPCGVHELVAREMRGKCGGTSGMAKIGGFALSAISYYHACEHITRNSRADSCTHCLHARYKCKAGVNQAHTLTGWRAYFLFCLLAILEFYLVGVGALDDPQES